MQVPELKDIMAAAERIAPYVRRTPLLSSAELNTLCGLDLVFKPENLQIGGAFKFRGACNTILSLDEATAAKGIATQSSGNHAAAVSLAAQMRGLKADVVMPRNSPQNKRRRVRAAGGTIHLCEPNQAARNSELNRVVAETGAYVVHPFNDMRIVCGQATVAMEALSDDPSIDHVIAPVGGGGIMAGTALGVHYTKPQTTVWAGEPQGADDAWLSMRAGEITPTAKIDTIADGLLTTVGEVTFPIIKEHVEEVVLVDDAEIVRAMRILWEYLNIIVEPSGAVPFAAALKQADQLRNKRLLIIITGGNVDLDRAFNLFKQYA